MRVRLIAAAALALIASTGPAVATIYTLTGYGKLTYNNRYNSDRPLLAPGTSVTGYASVDTGTVIIPDRFSGQYFLDEQALESGAQKFAFSVGGIVSGSNHDRTGGLIDQGAYLTFDRGRLVDIGALSWIDPDISYVGGRRFGYYSDYSGRDLRGFFYYNISTAPVPEPGVWAMLIIGFGLVGGALRRRGALRTTGVHA